MKMPLSGGLRVNTKKKRSYVIFKETNRKQMCMSRWKRYRINLLLI